MTSTSEHAATAPSTTVCRTGSLREPNRLAIKEDTSTHDNGVLLSNKRSLSNDKMSTDSMVPVFMYQRGSSLRHFGKTTLANSTLNSSSHHPFQIIKPIETSPRTSELCIDADSSNKVSSQRLKFKHRTPVPSQGGPLIPDHNLMKEPPKDSVTYTPRPPLVKRFSSDLEETNSDIEISQSTKTIRSYQIHTTIAAPKPPISPTRVAIQAPKCVVGVDKAEIIHDPGDEDTSEIENLPNSDCETPPPSIEPSDTINSATHRSSLRKESDSPSHSDVPGRCSPSPTKTVKWNLNTEVKKIPRSRSLNGKLKSPRPRSKSGADKNSKICLIDQKVVDSHRSFVSDCTKIIRQQGDLIEKLRRNRILVSDYKRDLSESLEYQLKLVTTLQSILDNTGNSKEQTSPISKL